MIPGLKEFVETGNVKAIEEYLQVEIDDYLVYIETAYDLLYKATYDYIDEDDEWNAVAHDWLGAASMVLGK